jgi:hypothetical protein
MAYFSVCSGQQNEIWACGFSWLTGPVGLWSEKFFVKTAILAVHLQKCSHLSNEIRVMQNCLHSKTFMIYFLKRVNIKKNVGYVHFEFFPILFNS